MKKLALLAVLAAVFLFITGQDVVISDSIPLLNIGCIALVIVGALSIFSFKNRKRQIRKQKIKIRKWSVPVVINVIEYYLLRNTSG